MSNKAIRDLAAEYGMTQRLVSELARQKIIALADPHLDHMMTALKRAFASAPIIRQILAPLTKATRIRLVATAGMSRPEAWAFGRWLAHFRRLRDVTSPPPDASTRRLPLKIVMTELSIYFKIRKPSHFLRLAVKRLRRKAYVTARNEYEALFPPTPVSAPPRSPTTAAPRPGHTAGQSVSARPPASEQS